MEGLYEKIRAILLPHKVVIETIILKPLHSLLGTLKSSTIFEKSMDLNSKIINLTAKKNIHHKNHLKFDTFLRTFLKHK